MSVITTCRAPTKRARPSRSGTEGWPRAARAFFTSKAFEKVWRSVDKGDYAQALKFTDAIAKGAKVAAAIGAFDIAQGVVVADLRITPAPDGSAALTAVLTVATGDVRAAAPIGPWDERWAIAGTAVLGV